MFLFPGQQERYQGSVQKEFISDTRALLDLRGRR